MQFDPHQYGPVLSRLIDSDRRRPLDAGTPVASMRDALDELTIDNAFAHARIGNRDVASCCLSGVWLLYDFLDESHTISQSVHNASGSFWHGIMHRREGDYSNAKYWFRNVGSHPVYASLAAAARELAAASDSVTAREMAGRDDWDPYRFVDLCQAAVRQTPADEPLLVSIQAAEWELLFDHCYAHAIA